MSLTLGFQLKQAQQQQLALTPQLKQAIRILQLPRADLIEEVREALIENPLLEEQSEIMSSEHQPETAAERKAQELSETTPEAEGDREQPSEREQIDWESYFENYSSPLPAQRLHDDDLPGVEATFARGETLFDHLLWQLQVSSLTPEEQQMACEIIGNIDECGYLQGVTVEELAEEQGASVEFVEHVLSIVQTLDPLGVGARNLRECLLIQAKFLELGAIVCDVLTDHFDALAKQQYPQIARAMGLDVDEIVETARVISQLDPKPGRIYGGEQPRYITPDVYIRKINGEYRAVLNDDGLPRLKISPFYRQALVSEKSPDTKKYVQEKLNQAAFMIRSLGQRQQTIQRVTEVIIERQLDFLENGVEALKPMILRDVAERLELHESTVSRATMQKYVHTPQGIYELKFFFNSAISTEDGEDIASRAVQSRIKALIAGEPQGKPLSDQKLAEILEEEGIHIARRTIAKYRESLGILPSSRRKKLF